MIKNGWRWAIDPDEVETYKDSGKWLIFLNAEQENLMWNRICESLSYGELAQCCYKAKMALRPRFNEVSKENLKVVCIYTKDFNDKEQVKNCLKVLRSLGFNDVMYYKTDNQTRSGLYRGGSQKSYIYCSRRDDDFSIA